MAADLTTPWSIALTINHGIGLAPPDKRAAALRDAEQIHEHHVAPLLRAIAEHQRAEGELRKILGLVPEATTEQIVHHASVQRADYLEQHRVHVEAYNKQLVETERVRAELKKLIKRPATIDVHDPKPLEHAFEIVDAAAQIAGPAHWLWDLRDLMQRAVDAKE